MCVSVQVERLSALEYIRERPSWTIERIALQWFDLATGCTRLAPNFVLGFRGNVGLVGLFEFVLGLVFPPPSLGILGSRRYILANIGY